MEFAQRERESLDKESAEGLKMNRCILVKGHKKPLTMDRETHHGL